ncbi:MAG: hypothetical protein HOQ22_12600 [Nocardioidaceae bacterium]|nr:hypothetical protein [Nocardioidaceae bacterium]NUS51861.1 hypothetical protein [Nocardioidaceae bacterium]
MIVPVLAALLVVAVVVTLLLALKRNAASQARKEATLESPQNETLVYPLPPGQDAAFVVAALERAGFVAVSEPTGGINGVTVDCPNGAARDRERVREVLQHIGSTGFEGEEMHVTDVVFADERDR